ncbi:MAG TPA: DUF3570 domain-containing protein [Cyclobacteriaceae bacterium]|nr:DUF3570 domain-containing protein [Cyclobacteriaceae bacterium]
MKRRYLVLGLITTAFTSFGQINKKNYTKKDLYHTDVEVVFSYYNQNNDHSAVTGGIGTEDLQVYVTHLSLDNIKDSVRTVHFDLGFDVISSASTDNIDFVLSSASKVDARIYTSLGYNRLMQDKQTTWGINSSFSIESDYLSWGQSFSISHLSEDQTREVSAALQMYFDDLRWGRYQFDGIRELVYPVELRTTKWFDNYRRNSYNLALGLYQTINRRMALGIYPGLTYQSGLLSTPFHRVYFADNSKQVERLPDSRLKIPIGIQLNTFIGTCWVLRTHYRYYWDDFGISGHTLNVETPVKISRVITLTPFVRLYNQQGSDFFKPYAEHVISQEFFTSDYDLSKFRSTATGLGFRYAPYSHKGRNTLKALDLRFTHYERSDGMIANMLTLVVNYDKEQKSQ